jgi:hypothetical protein
MREELIQLGFEELPHRTIGNSLIYYIRSKYNKTRILSISDLNTPNEFITIGELKADNKTYEDLTVIHNYDYDGNITVERLKALLFGLTGKQH